MRMKTPKNLLNIIQELCAVGYETYAAGGCIRDAFLKKEPKSWRIYTSALPKTVQILFDEYDLNRCPKSNIVMLFDGETKYEIVTIDNGLRKKSSINDIIPLDIEKVLSQRDFTINTIAYNDSGLIVNYFEGYNDLRRRVIRCVGDPNEKMKKDSLNILRALRYAACLNFSIDKETSNAIHKNAGLLAKVPKRRIRDELCKLLSGVNSTKVLLNYADVFAVIIPELEPCIGFNQNNPYHCFDVYEHMVRAVENYAGTDIEIKFALFLHDIGKPDCYFTDERGGHFYGHPVNSAEKAEIITSRLHFNEQTKNNIVKLVRYHDFDFPTTAKGVKRLLNKIGEYSMNQLLEVKAADIKAHTPQTSDALLLKLTEFNQLLNYVLSSDTQIKRLKLSVNGKDIVALGGKVGPNIGRIIQTLEQEVANNTIPNEKEALLERIRELLATGDTKNEQL